MVSNMLTFKKFVDLKEELTPEQKEHVSNWHRDPEAIKHTDHYFGVGNDERHEPLEGTMNKSEIHRQVEHHLKRQIPHEDYKAGYTTDEHQRKVKIGGLLKKTKAPDELLKGFANDNTRQGKKFTGLTVRTTRSAEGVAGQTSGSQSWVDQSCKNYDTGMNRHYLPKEVQHGTVVSYLHDHTGKELARATFQPHINDTGKRMYKFNSYYGIDHAGFREHNKRTEEELSGPHTDGSKLYHIHPDVYNDNATDSTFHHSASKEFLQHHIDNFHNDIHGLEHLLPAVNHKNSDGEILHNALTKANEFHKESHDDYGLGSFYKLAMENNPHVDDTHIARGYHHPIADVKLETLMHPKIGYHRLMEAVADKDHSIATTALLNPTATVDHHIEAMENGVEGTKYFAIKHPGIPRKYIDEALNGNNKNMKRAVAHQPNLTKEDLHILMNSDEPSVVKAALSHGKIDRDHINIGLNHKDDTVRAKTFRNTDLITPADITEGLKDKSEKVKYAAMLNPNADNNNIKEGLDSDEESVNAVAAYHKNINALNLHKALSNNNPIIRRHAAQHDNADIEHLQRAVMDNDYTTRMSALMHPKADESVFRLAKRDELEIAKLNRLGRSFNESFIVEELTPDQKIKVAKWKRDPEAIKHTDHFFGVGNDERIDHLAGTMQKSEIHRAVENHLGHQIEPVHYKEGHTFDKYNRKVRIGALLQKTKAPKNLQDNFANDSTRQAKGFTGLHVLTTRSAAGVAGQTSRGQPWEQQSCKNFDTGVNKRYLPKEVEHGTVVSYLRDHNNNDLARATFHPYVNSAGHRMYKFNSYYGVDHAGFKEHIKQKEAELSGPHKGGNVLYNIHPDVYNDRGVIHNGQHDENDPGEYIDDILPKDKEIHPLASHEDLHKIVDSPSTHYKNKMIAAIHDNFDSEGIHKLLKSSVDDDVKYALLKRSKNINGDHIHEILHNPDLVRTSLMKGMMRKEAAGHSKIKESDLNDLANGNDTELKNIVGRNPAATINQLKDWSKSKNIHLLRGISKNENTPDEVLSDLAKNPSETIVANATTHKNASDATRRLGLEHPELSVNMRTAKSRHLPMHMLNELYNHKNEFVKEAAIKNPKTSAKKLMDVINDPEASIQSKIYAIDHDNANAEHYKAALSKHQHSSVRDYAKQALDSLEPDDDPSK